MAAPGQKFSKSQHPVFTELYIWRIVCLYRIIYIDFLFLKKGMGRLWRVKWLQKYLYQGAEPFFFTFTRALNFFWQGVTRVHRKTRYWASLLPPRPRLHHCLLVAGSLFFKKKNPPSFRILEGDLVHAYSRARSHTHTHTHTNQFDAFQVSGDIKTVLEIVGVDFRHCKWVRGPQRYTPRLFTY